MKRRNFIQSSLIAGTGLLSGGSLVSCKNKNSDSDICHNSEFAVDADFDELTIGDFQEKMANGTYTAKDIVNRYLLRIEEIDANGPNLNSVLQINPDALSIAESLDRERENGKVRGPLHGIPLLLKGNIDTSDKMYTNAGATAIANSMAGKDAFLVQQLRKAGAVILGKANLSEWANFRSTRSSSGWSSVLGQTRNPYILDRSPCGSSSGSGVAVAANLCAAAIGTETDGSIVCPSSINGIVGIKPTIGAVSRSGIIPISHSCDTAGPMARTVTDAALLLGALTGIDRADKSMKGRPESFIHSDYTRFLDPDGLKGARIGIARKFFGFHEEVDHLMENAIERMKDKGATFVELNDFEITEEVNKHQWLVLLYEFKAGVNSYLSSLGASSPMKSLKDVIAFNKKNASTAMPFFKQEIFEQAQAKGDLTSEEYLDALKKMKQLTGPEGIDRVMAANNLDAIIAPTGSPAWCIDLVNGDHYIGGSSSPAAISGYPNVTVPAGFIHGLPVGISFFGKAFSEPTLIKLAFAFEQATKVRQKPGFLPTLDMR